MVQLTAGGEGKGRLGYKNRGEIDKISISVKRMEGCIYIARVSTMFSSIQSGEKEW